MGKLKQRMVGTIVLIALSVIIIPIIVDELPYQKTKQFQLNIPDSPYKDRNGRAHLHKEIKLTNDLANNQTKETGMSLPAAVQRNFQDSLIEKREIVNAGKDKLTFAHKKVSKILVPQASNKPDSPVRQWVIQVGSFSEKKNALALRNRLRKEGYSVFVERIKHQNREHLRVRVGPHITRNQAELEMRALKKSSGIDGVIARYP